MASCAESIRQRLLRLKCPFLPVGMDGGFAVFAFIDNTMNATCRPGGGPARDGSNAPRNDPKHPVHMVQWLEKIHGLKWQTVDMPNGMNFYVYGPLSRRNDLT